MNLDWFKDLKAIEQTGSFYVIAKNEGITLSLPPDE